MMSILTALLILATITQVFAQGYQLPDPLTLHYGTHKIAIPQTDTNGPHDYSSESCRGFTDCSVVHAVIRRKSTLYVVYSCAGWSRGPESRGGNCGSGWEHQMNWAAIVDGRVTSFQQMDIESCWRNTSGSIDGWKKGILVWGSDGMKTGYTGFFDPQSPEKGLQTMETHNFPINPAAQQGGARQAATRSGSKSEVSDKPQPESEGALR